MDGRRVERSVEFDRDVAHGEAKLCKTLVLATILNFCPFIPHRRSPLPSPVFPRQDLPLNQTPSHLSLYRDETKNWPTRSILLGHPNPLFFSTNRKAFSLFTFFRFPRKLIKTATGDETGKDWNIGIGEWNLGIPTNRAEQPTYVSRIIFPTNSME